MIAMVNNVMLRIMNRYFGASPGISMIKTCLLRKCLIHANKVIKQETPPLFFGATFALMTSYFLGGLCIDVVD